MKVVLATLNEKKVLELAPKLAPLGFALISQASLNIREADEPYNTFIENALAKARHAAQASGLAAIADDSGICLPALNGMPGVHSKHFAGPNAGDEVNNQHLLHLLDKATDRRAYYVSVLVFLRHADDPQPLIAQGTWWGEIIRSPRGQNGFGYDPYFFDQRSGKTGAEMTPLEKNKVSHRGQAVDKLIEQLQLAQLC